MEDRVIEYKRELTKDVDGLEREVVSFLNTNGGELFIGMNDDGTVYGVDDTDAVQIQIAQRLDSNIHPSCLGLFDIHIERRDGRHIVKVVVSAGSERPYYLTKYGMTSKGCYYRVGASCRQMTESMIRELYSKRVPRTIANIESPDQDLTFQVLEIYYRNHGLTLTDQFAKNLDFLTPDGKYNFVAYLFSDNNHLTFKVAKYAGTDKCDLIESSEYGFGCLLQTADRIIDRLHVENRTWTRITSKYRLERHMFEPVPVREAVINMLVHNDYTHGYTPVVELFSDRLELTSHGGLPEGLSEDMFFKGVSRPRNREIMRIFHDVDMVEQLGSGMNRILQYYDKGIFEIFEDTIKVVFRFAMSVDDAIPNGSQMTREQSAISPRTDEKTVISPRTDKTIRKSVSKEAVKADILSFLRNNHTASYQEISDAVGVVRSTAGKYVKELVEAGLLRREGNNRSGYWKLL